MKVDRYYDPYEDLEKEVLEELEYNCLRLGGVMTKLTKSDSTGRSSKVIEIEYDIQTHKKEERQYAKDRMEYFREFHRVIAPVVVLKKDE